MPNFLKNILGRITPSSPLGFQVIIWLVCSFFVMFFLKAFEVSEAREGVVVGEIYNYNTWILPLRHGSIIPSKPPLFHWLSAIISILIGAVNDFSLRAPSLIGGIILAWSTYSYTSKKLGASLASLTLTFVLTSYCFLQMATDGRVDMLFCGLINFCLFKFLTIYKTQSEDHPSLKDKLEIGVVLGLSVLTKGPLGPVLMAVGSFPLLALKYKQRIFSLRLLRTWYCNISLVLMLVIASPWYLLAYFGGNTGFVSRQLVFENISRFFGSKDIPHKPLWFYFQHLGTQIPICSLVLAFCMYNFLRKRDNLTLKDYFKIPDQNWEAFKIVAIQAFSILIFLSLSSGKRRAYLLPLVPHLSILCSIMLKAFIEKTPIILIKITDALCKLIFSLTVILNIIKLFIDKLPNNKTNSFLIGLNHLPFQHSLILIIILLILLIICNLCLERSDNKDYLQLYFTSAFFIIYLALPVQFFLTKGYSHSFYFFAEEISKLNLPNNNIYFIKKIKDESYDTFFFYFNKRVNIQSLEEPVISKRYYIATQKWFKTNAPQNSNQIYIGGREKDPEDKKLVLFKVEPKD